MLSLLTLAALATGCGTKKEEAPASASGSTYYEGKMEKPAGKAVPGAGAMKDL
jgi:hypothetical protein